HINVFPTFENYLDQFRIFIDKIEIDGQLIYNEEDATLRNMVTQKRRAELYYYPYGVPSHIIKAGKTTVNLEGEAV
ncbi:MAG: peptidoglycan synthetase, partial [Chitinophagaceae bacterium]|nr:peptidoglycan synthetase [Chitinophagaceae bacterium]